MSDKAFASYVMTLPLSTLVNLCDYVSDDLLIASSRYIPISFMVNLTPHLKIEDLIRIVPRLDDSIVFECFRQCPQEVNEKIMAYFPRRELKKLLRRAPPNLIEKSILNYTGNYRSESKEVFVLVEELFPQFRSQIQKIRIKYNLG